MASPFAILGGNNDVRLNSHALCRKSMKTFIDDRELRQVEEIRPDLLKGFEVVKIWVITVMKKHRFSTLCLNELVEIFEYKRKNGQFVIPVFYHGTVYELQGQRVFFGGDAFVEHERWFKEHPEIVQKWREELTDASRLSGFRFTITSR